MIFIICYAYQFCYIPVVWFKKQKKFTASKYHKYAVVTAAINEEAVIGNLIDSIRRQNYPSDLVDIFVIADNCTDATAVAARNAGAVVYERFDEKKRGKGYALKFLFDKINEDYGWDSYDGFFIFDADNLLDKNYIREMNKTFDNGYRIITSYRNTKNYDSNWITAGYSLWFLREAKYLNGARMLLGTSCAVSGTGFLFHKDILKRTEGWNYFLLTEDIEFTLDNILQGECIGYCGTAVFYDEQPTTFSRSWNQRVRWTRGYYQVFAKFGKRLIRGLFTKKAFTYFDMSMIILPAILFAFVSILVNAAALVITLCVHAPLIPLLKALGLLILNAYLAVFIVGAITTATEWKNIRCPAWKKIFYVFTFPFFMFTYVPIAVAATFLKVSWKPVKHDVTVTIDDLKK